MLLLFLVRLDISEFHNHCLICLNVQDLDDIDKSSKPGVIIGVWYFLQVLLPSALFNIC